MSEGRFRTLREESSGSPVLQTRPQGALRRRFHTLFRRPTSFTVTPGIIASDTIHALSPSLNRHRGPADTASTPSMIRVTVLPHQRLPQCILVLAAHANRRAGIAGRRPSGLWLASCPPCSRGAWIAKSIVRWSMKDRPYCADLETILAGMPTAVEPAGTSLVTTAFAPILA